MSALAYAIDEEKIELEAKITSKGQVTLPVALRKKMGLVEGGKVKFVLVKGGAFMKRPLRPIDAIGLLKGFDLPDDIADIPKEKDRF